MVIARNRQHAAPWRGASHVGMFENIGTTVHTRTFAIPNAKDAVHLVATRRCKAKLLRTPQRRGRQLFIHAGLKNNVVLF